MNAYRKRFVQLNMLIIGLLLLLVVTAMGVQSWYAARDELRLTMEQVVEPLENARLTAAPPTWEDGTEPPEAPGGPGPQDYDRVDAATKDPTPRREEDRGIQTIFYNAGSGEYSVLSRSELFNADTLAAALPEIMAQESFFGRLSEYGMIYYRSGTGERVRIALAAADYVGSAMRQRVLILAVVWLAAMLCFFPLSLFLSRLAVRPMEEAMAREKQFIADASHDLKTPLSVILANSAILRESPEATVGSREKWLESTEDAARNMQRLIHEMLTLSELEQHGAPPELERVDLSALVTKAALQLESVAYEQGVELASEIAEGLVAETNADYCRRIASGLMENAIKYEGVGGRVDVSLSSLRGRAVLTVHNRALIDPEDLPHVFERFYRADRSRGTHSGHGLGLAIIREMCQRLGGSIRAESSPETGTVFTVSLTL